jgi:hypothetical protein
LAWNTLYYRVSFETKIYQQICPAWSTLYCRCIFWNKNLPTNMSSVKYAILTKTYVQHVPILSLHLLNKNLPTNMSSMNYTILSLYLLKQTFTNKYVRHEVQYTDQQICPAWSTLYCSFIFWNKNLPINMSGMNYTKLTLCIFWNKNLPTNMSGMNYTKLTLCIFWNKHLPTNMSQAWSTLYWTTNMSSLKYTLQVTCIVWNKNLPVSMSGMKVHYTVSVSFETKIYQ